jgi:TolB-like protein
MPLLGRESNLPAFLLRFLRYTACLMSLIAELKRRNVFKVAIAYLVASWLIIQLADILVPMLALPEWVSRFVFLMLVVLLIPTLIAAWALELTPDGLKLEKNVDRSQSITPQTGQKLNHMIIGVLALAVVLLLVDRVWLPGGESSTASVTTSVEKSVAVLPFADLSQNQDQEWFADGLAEEILNALARTPDLLISARTSTFAYKGTDKDIPTIAKELGVAHVLEGSVRRAGERIRVTAQLIRAADGFHLWSQNYDRDTTDVIEIQEDLAIQIASALETTMDPESLANMVQVGTSSVEAYQAYIHGAALHARSLLENDRETMREGYEYFERARQLDPEFSRAHGAAAQYWVMQMSLTMFYMENDASAMAEVLQEFYVRSDSAIDTAKSETEELFLRAGRAEVDLRYRQALRLYEAYLEQRPNDLIAWAAYLDVATDISEPAAIGKAMEVLREAGRNRPEAANYFMDYAYLHLDPNDGADYGLAAIERWPLMNIMYQTHRNLLFAQRVEEAADLVKTFEQKYNRHGVMRARQACAEDRPEEVRRILGIYGPDITVNAANPLWLIYKMLGEDEKALEVLRHFENPQVPFILAAWMNYRQFDPTPFPALMQVLERENVDRPPAIVLPYACTPKPDSV